MRQSVFLASEPSPATQAMAEMGRGEGGGGSRWVEVKEGGVLRQRAGHTGRLKELLPSIDPVKIGLHLRPSLRRRLFVCIDKSCDLADETLCLLSIQRGGGGVGGGGAEVRKRRRRNNNSAAKSSSSSQANLFYVLDKLAEKLDLFFFLWVGGGGLSPDPPRKEKGPIKRELI